MSSAEQRIYEQQAHWARHKGLPIEDLTRAGEAGPKLYVRDRCHNLFQPLHSDVCKQFDLADGAELKQKMCALHSSSALAVNVLQYWCSRDREPLTSALGWPSGPERIRFEHKFCKPEGIRGTWPNLDVVLTYNGHPEIDLVAVESKMVEPYRDGAKRLHEAYLHERYWRELPHCGKYAMGLNDRLAEGTPGRLRFLDAAQLLRHLLCIHHCHGRRFRLVYLWYDVPGEEGNQHRREAEEFKATVAQDGIPFQPATYQELISKLADSCQGAHAQYVDYLRERYLFA